MIAVTFALFALQAAVPDGRNVAAVEPATLNYWGCLDDGYSMGAKEGVDLNALANEVVRKCADDREQQGRAAMSALRGRGTLANDEERQQLIDLSFDALERDLKTIAATMAKSLNGNGVVQNAQN